VADTCEHVNEPSNSVRSRGNFLTTCVTKFPISWSSVVRYVSNVYILTEHLQPSYFPIYSDDNS
jgi:hypothetical protein